MASRFTVRPLTPDTWTDLEELFGLPGGSIVRGCWCMFYRRTGKHSGELNGAENKPQLRRLVDEGTVPGLVGYLGGSPVGWISLGPRADYRKLQRSPIMKPVDDADVWSIVCTYVAKAFRGLLEAYPVDKPQRSHDDFMYFGSRSLYERAGFTEVVRRSPTRVVMRRRLRPRTP
jgi:hypothetical protein